MTNFTDEELEEINQIIDRVIDEKIQELTEKLKSISSHYISYEHTGGSG